jgi:hypothetical protein
MATNKKPRKAYKPKRKVGDLLGYMSKIKPATIDEDLISYQVSLGAILHGTAVIRDADMLTGALNACAVLCLQHKWDDHYATAVLGQRAQQSLNNRVRAGGPICYTGLEMQAVKDALALFEAQMPLLTPKDLTNAAVLVTQTLVARNFAKPL